MEVKGIFSSIKSSINGMSSQMARIGAISQNIANAEKLPDEDGNVYKRKIVKQSGYNSSGNNFDQQLSIKMKKTKSSHFGGGNELSGSSSAAGRGFEIIELDEVDKIYDPNNPLAGDDGYVVMPKINTISDKDKKRKQYSKSFKKFHLFSIVLYLLKMLASIIGIILIYN